jgi:nicotinate-nucleotide--dimethylbenzimidazole phosphoribosyltransferase
VNLSKILSSIPTLNQKAMQNAEKRQAQLTKPAKSLGRLEDIAIQAAGITGQAIPSLGKKRVILCAGDHGITVEGVSAFPSAVTP